MTIDYYDKHGHQFTAQTKYLDMSSFYQPFLALIPHNGHILDVGCGSGRDTKAFLEKGYRVTAFDASETLVALAAEYTQQPILKLRFQELSFSNEFDGIWASASLLHVPKQELDAIFERLINALKPKGVWYLSFKKGSGELVSDDGRLFNYMDRDEFVSLISRHPMLSIEKYWENADTRPEKSELWINAVLRKASS